MIYKYLEIFFRISFSFLIYYLFKNNHLNIQIPEAVIFFSVENFISLLLTPINISLVARELWVVFSLEVVKLLKFRRSVMEEMLYEILDKYSTAKVFIIGDYNIGLFKLNRNKKYYRKKEKRLPVPPTSCHFLPSFTPKTNTPQL